jgi:glycosyltransferase involved in cell wall biosynthesis
VKRFASRRAHWFFAYNDMGARVVAEIGFPRERTTIVQNAIDTRALRCRLAVTSADELAGLRTSLGLRGSNVAIYAGAMYADKRLDFLVAAAEEARRLLPDFELLMIGSGPDAHVARAAAERHPWIKYLGPTFGDGKVPLFMLSKAMLLPGVVGLAVLDAFALETPLVTVALPSHGPEIDYLEPGVNGVMLRQGATAAEYAGEVVRLLEDDAGREQLREGCRRAAARYTMEAMVERFADGVIAALDQDGAP